MTERTLEEWKARAIELERAAEIAERLQHRVESLEEQLVARIADLDDAPAPATFGGAANG